MLSFPAAPAVRIWTSGKAAAVAASFNARRRVTGRVDFMTYTPFAALLDRRCVQIRPPVAASPARRGPGAPPHGCIGTIRGPAKKSEGKIVPALVISGHGLPAEEP